MPKDLARSFQSADVAAAYAHRPPYPPELFDRLESLMADGPRTILDLGAVLAIVNQGYQGLEWAVGLREVIVRHSRSPDFNPDFSLPEELSRLGLFQIQGRHLCEPTYVRQSVAHYIEQFHSTASLARHLMPAEEAEEFDHEVEASVRDHQDADGVHHHTGQAVSRSLTAYDHEKLLA